jgi:pantothenate kinase type III
VSDVRRESRPTCTIVARTLDICKTALTILAHDPEFKSQGGIILPGPIVLMSQSHNLISSIAQSPDGTIVVKAIDPAPTVVTPGGIASSN